MSIALPPDGGSALSPWLAFYPEGVPASLDYPAQPVWWLLQRAAQRAPQRSAVVYYNQVISYHELFLRSRRAAAVFAHQGIRPGDRVGLLLPNTPEYLIAAYGVWMAGGTVVSINPLAAPAEVTRLVRATGCRTIVAMDLLLPLLKDVLEIPKSIFTTTIRGHLPPGKRLAYQLACWYRQRAVRRSASRFCSFTAELAKCDPLQNLETTEPDKPAYILPTGGTTAAAKAVVLTHGNLVANAWQLTHWTGQSFGEESLLPVVPFFHSYGLSTCATAGVASAATMILHHRFDVKAVARLLKKHKPTCFPAVPMMLYKLNQLLPDWKPGQQPLVQICVTGGAPLPRPLADEFARRTGAVVVEGYGLSEASPVTHVGPLDGSAKAGTIGFPLPDTHARIVDADDGETSLAPGTVGELIIRGPQVMSGYFEDQQATAQAIRNGWLYTGDLARQREDGSFEIVDRKKDLIITSGANVFPSDVEHVLRQVPGVQDAAVVGVPDAQRGELVKAFLKVENRARFDHRQLARFLEDRLARFKRPRIIELVETELPKNFLGKVVRRELRES